MQRHALVWHNPRGYVARWLEGVTSRSAHPMPTVLRVGALRFLVSRETTSVKQHCLNKF